MIKENTSECSNINMHNGFLEISKRCKINCISGHIVPRIYNSLAKKVWSGTRSKLFYSNNRLFIARCDWFSVKITHTNCSPLVPMTKLIRLIRQVNCHGAPVGPNIDDRDLHGTSKLHLNAAALLCCIYTDIYGLKSTGLYLSTDKKKYLARHIYSLIVFEVKIKNEFAVFRFKMNGLAFCTLGVVVAAMFMTSIVHINGIRVNCLHSVICQLFNKRTLWHLSLNSVLLLGCVASRPVIGGLLCSSNSTKITDGVASATMTSAMTAVVFQMLDTVIWHGLHYPRRPAQYIISIKPARSKATWQLVLGLLNA